MPERIRCHLSLSGVTPERIRCTPERIRGVSAAPVERIRCIFERIRCTSERIRSLSVSGAKHAFCTYFTTLLPERIQCFDYFRQNVATKTRFYQQCCSFLKLFSITAVFAAGFRWCSRRKCTTAVGAGCGGVQLPSPPLPSPPSMRVSSFLLRWDGWQVGHII